MRKSTPSAAQVAAAKAVARHEYDRFMALSDADKTRAAGAAAKVKSRPLTRAERAMFDQIGLGRPRGRPVKGRGARQISVTMERGLLARVDQYAQAHGLTRAQLIAQALERALSAA